MKFGIIGVGLAFHFHSNGDRGSKITVYTAVYDRNFENAKKMIMLHQDSVMVLYEPLDEMLIADIDAVLVMVPHEYHVEMVVKVAKVGKHVICEDLMAITVEGCRQMIKACKEAGVKLMVAENHRFILAHVYMHNLVKQVLIGDVLMIRAYEGVNEISGMMRSGFWTEHTIKILERLAPALPIHQHLPQVNVAEPLGYNKKRAAAMMEQYDLDLLIAASPVNVCYLSGLPLLHSAPNPILLALNNQYPNLAMILREGDGTLIHWNVFKSASFFSWFTDTVSIES